MNGHGNRRRNNYGRGGHENNQTPEIPDVRYYNDDGKLRPELFDGEARETAKAMKNISHTQLRRFFGQVMADRRRFDLNPDSKDSEARVAMALFKAKTAYAAAREGKNMPIRKFAEHHANKVKSVKAFRDFARHFEAVIAWHKVYGNK